MSGDNPNTDTALAEAQAENERLKQRLATDAAARERAEADKVALEPAERAGIAALITALPAAADSASADFAEPGSSDPATPRARLIGFLRRLPVQVEYAEITRQAAEPPAAGWSGPADYAVEAGAMDLHKRVLALCESQGIGYEAALDRLTARAA